MFGTCRLVAARTQEDCSEADPNKTKQNIYYIYVYIYTYIHIYIYTYIHIIDAYIYTYIYVLNVHGVPGGSLVCASERGHSAFMFLVLGSSLAC